MTDYNSTLKETNPARQNHPAPGSPEEKRAINDFMNF